MLSDNLKIGRNEKFLTTVSPCFAVVGLFSETQCLPVFLTRACFDIIAGIFLSDEMEICRSGDRGFRFCRANELVVS